MLTFCAQEFRILKHECGTTNLSAEVLATVGVALPSSASRVITVAHVNDAFLTKRPEFVHIEYHFRIR